MKFFWKATLPLIALNLLVSCHPDSDSKTEPTNITRDNTTNNPTSDSANDTDQVINQNEVVTADGSNINGFYAGDMIPLNYNLHFKKIGMAGVARDGDNFSTYVRIKNGPKSMVHRQAIYTGRRCPNLNDDINKDAYIDIEEAKVAMGRISIPLDDDLDSQEAGINQYPSGDEMGKMFYQKSASFERMFSDLKTPDTNPLDNIIKIGPDEGLTFPGRVIILQGIAESVLLPPTIAKGDDENAHQSLPMGCVVLWKVPQLPPELMTDAPPSSVIH